MAARGCTLSNGQRQRYKCDKDARYAQMHIFPKGVRVFLWHPSSRYAAFDCHLWLQARGSCVALSAHLAVQYPSRICTRTDWSAALFDCGIKSHEAFNICLCALLCRRDVHLGDSFRDRIQRADEGWLCPGPLCRARGSREYLGLFPNDREIHLWSREGAGHFGGAGSLASSSVQRPCEGAPLATCRRDCGLQGCSRLHSGKEPLC